MTRSETRPLKILYFAWLRERTGLAREDVFLPEGVTTVGQLMDHLSGRGPEYAAAFGNRKLMRCAVNQEFATPGSAVQPGDEVGFFPPVTGG